MKDQIKQAKLETLEAIIKEVEGVMSKYQKAEEGIENGKRYLLVGETKKPFGHPYPDTREKYALSDILTTIQAQKELIEKGGVDNSA